MKHTIFVVEDEDKIARILQLELEHDGYGVMHAGNGREAFEMAIAGGWDLMLLDIMLPELSGLEVLRRVREHGIMLPVILLTARDAVPDRVSGLDLGANDYVTKPFAIEELLARIRNLLRMAQQPAAVAASSDEEVRVDDLTMNIRTRQVMREGQQIDITPKEFDLLLYLISHQGEVLSREQIVSEVWGYDFIGDTNVVDVYIRNLRQKMDKGFSSKLIHTLRGVGYLVKDSEQKT
ncbi:response regulator transcription factor [Paenibacillus sp. NPDC056579]|uniref:response regulator transcription factor n=1 Tax=unclassified Paenibacillus TaxID=185978 RepID=UPI001EF87491|nr:response regulator transcription factor [Paenibacillus sp. H1-7]ULL13716.1 DNA-binding response regulator [Paenibacillus sp. H1-7]